MQGSPQALVALERCQCAGFFSKYWKRRKLDDTEMIQEGLRVGFTTTRSDLGQAAGEHCYKLGSDPGLQTDQADSHSQVVHLAALADILATSIRKKEEAPWVLPDPVKLGNGVVWRSEAFLSPDETHLRRVVLVSSWSDDRHYAEARSWRTLGEVCALEMPMQEIVCVIGASRNGKRHSWWTHGLRHPFNRKLRFRKKHQIDDGFKASWNEVWREDFDDISTRDWLQAMLDDGVLKDSLFKVDVPIPEKVARQQIIDLAIRKLDRVSQMESRPDKNLSTCDWPTPCHFRTPCHRNEEPNGRYGFVQIDR